MVIEERMKACWLALRSWQGRAEHGDRGENEGRLAGFVIMAGQGMVIEERMKAGWLAL